MRVMCEEKSIPDCASLHPGYGWHKSVRDGQVRQPANLPPGHAGRDLPPGAAMMLNPALDASPMADAKDIA
jgi:hypothetical protein